MMRYLKYFEDEEHIIIPEHILEEKEFAEQLFDYVRNISGYRCTFKVNNSTHKVTGYFAHAKTTYYGSFYDEKDNQRFTISVHFYGDRFEMSMIRNSSRSSEEFFNVLKKYKSVPPVVDNEESVYVDDSGNVFNFCFSYDYLSRIKADLTIGNYKKYSTEKRFDL